MSGDHCLRHNVVCAILEKKRNVRGGVGGENPNLMLIQRSYVMAAQWIYP